MTTTILVIDDSADDQRLYRRAFKDFDRFFSLLMTSSAADGFARISDAAPDLILLDYNLPDMDGLDFIKKLSEYSDSPIPVIMLTGESNTLIAVEAMKNGVDDYIVKDAGGQYLKLLPGVVGHVMAAHAQRELTRRLRQETETLLHRNQMLMKHSKDGIHVMDIRGNIVEANDAFCRMLGYTQEEMAQLNVADWDAQWSADELAVRFKSHLANNARFETVHRRKDGTLINVEVSTSGVEFEEQFLIFATSHDITARKRNQQETLALLRRNQAVMQNSMDGIHVLNLQGNIVEANDAFCRMLGYSQEEVSGLNVADWAAAFSGDELRARLKDHIGKSLMLETVHRRKNGSLIDVEISISGVEIDGQGLVYCSSRDITERKRAEGVLKLNKTIIETAYDGFWRYDTNGYLLEVNQAYADMVGYTIEELAGMHISRLSAQSNTPELVRARIEKAIGQGPGNFETQHRHKDGHVMDFEASIAYIPEANCLFSFIRDVTDRKKTEAVLRRHKQMVDTSLDGFWINDLQGNLLEANQAYATMSGYSVEELAHIHISQLEANEQATEVKAHTAKILAQGYDRFVTRHRRKDGRAFDVEVSATYIAEARQIFAFFRDITERKQIEKKLNLGAQLLNSTSDSVFLFDLDGNFVYLNEAAWKSRGYTRDEMMAMKLSELNTPEFKKLIAPRVKEVLEKGQATFEAAHLCKDGSIMPVEINSRVIDSDGQKLLLATIRDISERKQNEQVLLQNEANLRAMLDNSPYLTWLKDTEGRYITINKVFADYLRLDDARQATGKTDLDFQPKELAEKYRADDKNVMASRLQNHVEESAFDGKNFHWVETFKTPIIDAQGIVRGTVGFARDITERKQTEEALRVAAVTFETHDAIIITDADANIIQVNRAFSDITGYSAAEVLGQNPRIMSSGLHDRDFYQKMWQQLLHTGSWSGEIWDQRKNGQIYPKWMTITALKNEQQKIIQYISISSDISARVQAEEEILRESDERFRGTLEQAAVGIAHAALDGAYQQVNHKLCEILGYSPTELIRLSVQDVTFPDDLNKDSVFMRKILEGKISTFAVEKRYVRKDQTLVWVNLTVSLLHQSDGSPKYFIFVVEDITGRKAAERKILRLNNLYAAISRTNEAIVRIDDRDKLLAEICRIAVRYGRFKLAWVGLLDDTSSNLKVVASSGEATEYLTGLHISTDADKPEGCGPTGMAIRNNREYICNDFLNDPNTLYWRENAKKYGLHADASCPLELEGQVVGALTLYAGEVNYFDRDMTNLLIVLAKDISVALNNFVREDLRRLAEIELEESRQLLRDLVAQGEALREEERKHIAREIHDELGQVLTALRMDVSLLRIQFGARDEALLQKAQSMTVLLDRAIQGVRNVASNLRPATLEMGIVSAIEWLGHEFTEHTGVPCVVRLTQKYIELNETLAMVVFRIVQESLTNVTRHAGASGVEITLMQGADVLHVTVRDNGQGFDSANIGNRKSFGLLGMSERAMTLGGTVEITSVPQQGTVVSIRMPIKSKGDIL